MKFSDYIRKFQYEDRNPVSVMMNDKIRVNEYTEKKLKCSEQQYEWYFELFFHRLYAGYDIDECLAAIEKPCVVRLNNGWHIMKILLNCDDTITHAELQSWQNMEHKSGEWAPRQVRQGFTVERILPLRHNLIKIFVFHGRAEYLWWQVYDITGGKVGKLISATMYDRNWKKVNVQWNKAPLPDKPKPRRLADLIEIAEALFCDDFKFMRVDLYYNDDRIRLSELMNIHAGGTNGFSGNFDEVLGALL